MSDSKFNSDRISDENPRPMQVLQQVEEGLSAPAEILLISLKDYLVETYKQRGEVVSMSQTLEEKKTELDRLELETSQIRNRLVDILQEEEGFEYEECRDLVQTLELAADRKHTNG